MRHRIRLSVAPYGPLLTHHGCALAQAIRCDVLAIPQLKANLTRLHQTQEMLLLGHFVLALPHQRRQQLSREAPALAAQGRQDLLAVEQGVDPFQCPGLVEDHGAAKNVGPPKHLPRLVQVGQQGLRRAHAVFLAELLKILLRQHLLALPQATQPSAQAGPVARDQHLAVPLGQQFRAGPQFRHQAVQAILVLGAAGNAPQPMEAMVRRHGRLLDRTLLITPRLRNDHLRCWPHCGLEVVEPVAQRMRRQVHAAVQDGRLVFKLGMPKQQIKRAVVQEQAVGAEEKILSTKIPHPNRSSALSIRSMLRA